MVTAGNVVSFWSGAAPRPSMASALPENKIGVGSNSRGELPSAELGRVAAQLRQHDCGVVVNRMPDHGTDAGAGCPEVRDLKSGGVYSGESLRRRRSTNVSSADE